MAILDTTHKRKSSLITLVILIMFLLGIFSFGMQYQDPPVEYGIAINYGTSDFGNEKPINIPVKSSLTKDIQEEKPEELNEETSKEIINEKVLSQSDQDAPIIEKTKEVLKPKPKKPSKSTLKAFDNLLKGDTNDDNKVGEGNDDVSGLKGDKKGDPSSTKYYGNSGNSGDPNYNLAGRNALSKPIEQPNCQEEGMVVVSIEVDKNGKVIRALAGVKGTTNSANCLLKPAREEALRTTWNADPNAPFKQKGTIIYKFSLTK